MSLDSTLSLSSVSVTSSSFGLQGRHYHFVSGCISVSVSVLALTLKRYLSFYRVLMRTAQGHVSFPGGHRDEDEDPIAAAVRELHEEVDGIGEVTIVGKFHKFQASESFKQTAVLYYFRCSSHLSLVQNLFPSVSIATSSSFALVCRDL